MYDLISIGNISVDMFFGGDSLTFEGSRFQLAIGGKYFVEVFHQSLGGGGANVAIGVHKNGLKTAVLGKIGGNSFKHMILSELRSAGVSTALCQIEDEYLNVSSVLLSPDGERSIINYETPHMHLFADVEEMKVLRMAKAVYLGNLPDVSLSHREDILRFLKQHDVTTIINLGVKDCRRPRHQLEQFMSHADIIIMNGYEFAEMLKVPYEDITFRSHALDLAPFLADKTVIITDGSKGSHGYHKGRYVYQEAIPVKHIVDATGAGDGYTAAFIAEFLQSTDVEKAMNKGAHYAVKILSKLGAN